MASPGQISILIRHIPSWIGLSDPDGKHLLRLKELLLLIEAVNIWFWPRTAD
jgi:hypothetical protein